VDRVCCDEDCFLDRFDGIHYDDAQTELRDVRQHFGRTDQDGPREGICDSPWGLSQQSGPPLTLKMCGEGKEDAEWQR
jgi:hypothetical protein